MNSVTALQFSHIESAARRHAVGQVHGQHAALERPIVFRGREFGVKAGSEKVDGILHNVVVGGIVRVRQGPYQRRGIGRMAGSHMLRIDGFDSVVS